jgi:hypothetical protein
LNVARRVNEIVSSDHPYHGKNHPAEGLWCVAVAGIDEHEYTPLA